MASLLKHLSTTFISINGRWVTPSYQIAMGGNGSCLVCLVLKSFDAREYLSFKNYVVFSSMIADSSNEFRPSPPLGVK